MLILFVHKTLKSFWHPALTDDVFLVLKNLRNQFMTNEHPGMHDLYMEGI